MEKPTVEKIDLRSDDVQEILSRPPHSLIRYGISVICLVLLILLGGSFIFRYPDIIRGEIIITTENPPVWIVAQSTGRIKELYFSDKDSIKEGDLIAVVENPAKTDDVMMIKKILEEESCISDSSIYVPSRLFSRTYELGELQSQLSSFVKTVNNYKNFLSLNLTKQDKELIQNQISGREVYLSSLKKQVDLKKKEVALAKISCDRERNLYARGVISRSELEATEQSYLNLQQTLQQLESSIVSENVENTKLKGSILKLTLEYHQDKNNKYFDLVTAYTELIAEIKKWKQTYLLISPQSGTITFNTFWSKNQDVKLGDKVFAIISQEQSDFRGRIQLPSSGIGKVKLGQFVNIKVDGYPYLEYGVLRGRVKNISLVANENKYTVEVELPSKLNSTMAIEFDFTGELSGIAEIITEDRSIATHILSPLRHLFNNNITFPYPINSSYSQ